MTGITDVTLRALFRSLVEKVGGVDAAAAVIGCARGTISKQTGGSMQIVLSHVWALEDATGTYPVSDLRQTRRAAAGEAGEVAILSREVLDEIGDVAPAILGLVTSGDRDTAVKELTEAIGACSHLRDRIQTMGGEG